MTAAIALGLLLAGPLPTTPNLIPNPGFEQVEAGRMVGWEPHVWSGDDQCKWTIESRGHSGRRCVSIRSAVGADAAWTLHVPVEPRTRYRLSGWIRTREVRGAVGALLNIQNLQPVRTGRVAGTRGWTRVSTDFTTGDLADLEINCLFGGWGASTGQAWYDDIGLERIGTMTEGNRAQVNVDVDGPLLTASPLLRGGFLEHFDRQVYGGVFEPGSPLSDEKGFRKDVIAALKELKLSVVRWPGGCFASGYHWRDGVGPDRKPVPDPVWGVTDPNTFGTDEFVEWCRRVGCEPYICTNAGNGTPEEMRDWVAYCNRPGGPHVKYWSIGNENWGGHEIGARTAAEWGPLVKRCATLMRGADPNLELLAAATTGSDWTLPLLAAAGKQLQYVAIHDYWLPLWGENLMPDYMTCILNSDGPETTITGVGQLLRDAGVHGRVRIAYDEWNLRSWHHPGFPRKAPVDPSDTEAAALVKARTRADIASQYTMADALFTASFLNSCLRHADDVGMANIAPIVNTRGPLSVHPGGVVRRTTFHVLAMYANLLGDRVARTEVASPLLSPGPRSVATVDAIATCDQRRTRWRIVLVNRHPSEAIACTVRLGARLLTGHVGATLLDGDSQDAFNSVEQPDRVRPRRILLDLGAGTMTLPPHSVMVIGGAAPR